MIASTMTSTMLRPPRASGVPALPAGRPPHPSPASSARVLLGVALALGGCFPKSEGERLVAQQETLERRLRTLEDGTDEERAELREQLAAATEKVQELEGVLDQATALLTRNSADIGQEVVALREEIGRLEGEIAEVRNALEQAERRMGESRDELAMRIDRLARQAGVDITIDESEIPEERSEHYAAAYRAFQEGDHGRARALFRAFVRKYPEDDEADNAQYWIGKSYLEQDQPAAALRELRVVVSRYTRGDAADETLFDMADAFFRLGACTDAKSALDALIRGYRSSPLLRRARAKKREIDRAPRGRCTS